MLERDGPRKTKQRVPPQATLPTLNVGRIDWGVDMDISISSQRIEDETVDEVTWPTPGWYDIGCTCERCSHYREETGIRTIRDRDGIRIGEVMQMADGTVRRVV